MIKISHLQYNFYYRNMICLRKLLMVVLLSTFGILFYVSDSWARVFDDESVCNGAVVLNESNIKTWTTDYRFYEYVKEAKRRGLNCGIKSKEITKVAKQSTLPNCPKSGYKQNCYGSILYAHGGKYNGEWKNNFEHGFGEYAYSNGDKYIGNFKYGKKEGKGTFYFNDGSIYEGNYKDDQMNGKGSLTNINKEKYFGNFKENKKHGKGIIIKPNGSRKEVTFNYGFLNTDNKKRVKNKLADTSDEMLCFYATVGYASWDLTNPNYVNEAKRRGLDCGVEDDEAEKKRIAEELTHKKKLQEEKERKN